MKYLEKFLKAFLKDRRGVTPVVGVILMVAVTVVMGAVIAGFVYGYVGTTEKGPLVGLSIVNNPTDSDSILIKHTGGESIVEQDWSVSVGTGQASATKFLSAAITSGYTDARPSTDTLEVAAGENADLTAGRTMRVQMTTTGTPVVIVPGWYHLVIIHVPSNSLLIDSNVLVR